MKKKLIIGLLALLFGCGDKVNGSVAPVYSSSAVEAPKHLKAQQAGSAPTVAVAVMANPVSPDQAQSDEAKPAATDPATGETVYKSTCSICHKTGLNGAPRLGSRKDWERRLAQGNEILYDHAINGYRGSKGSMPSRGSNARLSESEVKATVDYMTARAIPSWEVGK